MLKYFLENKYSLTDWTYNKYLPDVKIKILYHCLDSFPYYTTDK